VYSHISVSWSVDEGFDIRGSNMTFRYNFSAEGLGNNCHPENDHSSAFIMSGDYDGGSSRGQNLAIVRNMFSNVRRRVPQHGGDMIAFTADNYVFGALQKVFINDKNQNSNPSFVTWTNNASEFADKMIVTSRHNGTQYYIDNHYDITNDVTYTYPDIWNEVTDEGFGDCAGSCRVDSPPWEPSGYEYYDLPTLKDHLIAKAGSRPAERHPIDVRLIGLIEAGTDRSYPDSPSDVGGYPIVSETYRSLSIPSNFNDLAPSGYTVLEEWLDDYREAVEGTTVAVVEPVEGGDRTGSRTGIRGGTR
jgi:hypothetical protein